MASFSKQLEQYAEKYKKRMRATMRESVQQTVDIAQKTRGEGGRMRVVTGFLWNSIQASIGQLPIGESRPEPGATYTYDGAALSATLLRWQPGEALFVGWTANYARPREYKDGFMRGAVERWDTTVDEVAIRVRRSL